MRRVVGSGMRVASDLPLQQSGWGVIGLVGQRRRLNAACLAQELQHGADGWQICRHCLASQST